MIRTEEGLDRWECNARCLVVDARRCRISRLRHHHERTERGSDGVAITDESARFGLDLFKKMDLQLLIVTPLQKIHIIEPYVSAVGFVHNEEGRRSRLRNLTIEEYRAEKLRRAG